MHPFKQKKIMVPDALQFLDRDVQQNVYDIDIVRRAYGQRLSFHQTKLARHDGFSEDAVSLARLQSEIFARKIERMDAATAAVEITTGADAAGFHFVQIFRRRALLENRSVVCQQSRRAHLVK